MNSIHSSLSKAGFTLRPYQVEGVEWMLRHEDNGDGGILADEPGLGKTVQALSLAIPDELKRPTLVVVPKSVVGQWRSRNPLRNPAATLTIASAQSL